MNLHDFLQSDAAVRLKADGIDDELYCKILSLDEMNNVLVGTDNQLQIGARLLSLCIVDKDGNAKTTTQNWLDLSFRKNAQVQALIKEVSVVNGLVQADEAEDLGKPSEPTGDSA